MSRRPPSVTLANFKGGDLLAQLRNKLSPKAEPHAAKPANGRRVDALGKEFEAALAANKALGIAPKLKLQPKPKLKPKSKSKSKLNKAANKAKPKQEVIRIADPALRREVIAAVKAAVPTPSGRNAEPQPKPQLGDFGASAFQKLLKLREKMDSFQAVHDGGADVQADDAASILRRIAKGAEAAETIINVDDGYFVGFDFGTSTTKAVVRYPYGGVDVAFAVDVPLSLACGGQPHLWPTALWWNESSGRFSPYLKADCIGLDSFKSALIQGSGRRMCNGKMTMAEAATAFIAIQLAYCIGAAIEQDSAFRLGGINVGVPVAALGQSATLSNFEQVFRAGLFLIPFASELTLGDVKAALDGQETSQIPYSLHTELSGAIAGYCMAPRHYVGGHMIIDCGSATLDMASFLLDGTSYKPIAIYDARVEPFGADSCLGYQDHGSSVEECRRASRYQEHLVYSETHSRATSGFAQEDKGFPYQIILIGGGIHSRVHGPLFQTMERAFHRQFHRPELAPTLDYDKRCEPGRLILADGLARDPIELRDVSMPRDPPPSVYRPPEMIGKEQV